MHSLSSLSLDQSQTFRFLANLRLEAKPAVSSSWSIVSMAHRKIGLPVSKKYTWLAPLACNFHQVAQRKELASSCESLNALVSLDLRRPGFMICSIRHRSSTALGNDRPIVEGEVGSRWRSNKVYACESNPRTLCARGSKAFVLGIKTSSSGSNQCSAAVPKASSGYQSGAQKLDPRGWCRECL